MTEPVIPDPIVTSREGAEALIWFALSEFAADLGAIGGEIAANLGDEAAGEVAYKVAQACLTRGRRIRRSL